MRTFNVERLFSIGSFIIFQTCSAIIGLDLDVDGSFAASTLGSDWLNSSCLAGSYRDFRIDVSEADLMSNLLVDVSFIPGAASLNVVQPKALSANIFYDLIPVDRSESMMSQMTSPNGIYSLHIGPNELRSGRYFVSVQCGDEDAEFDVRSFLQPAEITDKEIVTVHFCPDATPMHHFIEYGLDDKVAGRDVKISLCLPDSLSTNLVLTTKVGSPPFREMSPSLTLSGNGSTHGSIQCIEYEMCSEQLRDDKIWAGVIGSGQCGSYNITMSIVTSTSCSPSRGEVTAAPNVIDFEMERVFRSSCDVNGWVDFRLKVIFCFPLLVLLAFTLILWRHLFFSETAD